MLSKLKFSVLCTAAILLNPISAQITTDPSTAALARVAAQLQSQLAQRLIPSASEQAKSSVARIEAVVYAQDGALATLKDVRIDRSGTYAVELWATTSIYSAATSGSIVGRPLAKKVIGSFAAGTQIPEMWTVLPISATIPDNRYPTVLLTLDDGTAEWPYSAAQTTDTLVMDPNLPTVMAFEFYAPSLNHYFLTANTLEAVGLADNPRLGWQLTGQLQVHFNRNLAPRAGINNVCRFYGHPTIGPNSHFYTPNAGECENLKRLQTATPFGVPRWNYEEISFQSLQYAGGCSGTLVPAYRLYNNLAAQNDSNHRYVTNTSLYTQMASVGWVREGPLLCTSAIEVPPSLYR
jgi:hypothetical protein